MAYYNGKKSDHFDGEKFFIKGKPLTTTFFDFLKWRMNSAAKPWPKSVQNQFDDVPPGQVHQNELRVSFVGHATFLIQIGGFNILTDPVWSDRASPLSWIGPKRVHAPGIRFENLPKINLILVSHNHYDHLDLKTISRIYNRDRPKIIAPLGNDRIIQNFDRNIKVSTYDWGEGVTINDAMQIYLEPVQHWSARGIFDRNQALWGAFVMKTHIGNIVFLGDCGYGDGSFFKQMKEKYASFRLALIPIGAFKPEALMQYAHMGPKEAINAFKDLGAFYGVPMHHSTFPLADDWYSEALDLFHEECFKRNLNTASFKSLKIGEHWYVPHKMSYDENQEVISKENMKIILLKLQGDQLSLHQVSTWLNAIYHSCQIKVVHPQSDGDLIDLLLTTLENQDIMSMTKLHIEAFLEYMATPPGSSHEGYQKWKDYLERKSYEEIGFQD